ncbi:MAG: hypothetical protein ACFFDN_08150 [Candidatus Hodarchaeota archaeon]
MEIEWKWSTILSVVLISLGILTLILSVVIVGPIGHTVVTVTTLTFCIAYIGAGILVFFALGNSNKNLSLVALIVGLIMSSIALYTSILIISNNINLRTETLPLLLAAREGWDDLLDIFQLMFYYYYGSPISAIMPGATSFYWINLITSIISMATVTLVYIKFE